MLGSVQNPCAKGLLDRGLRKPGDAHTPSSSSARRWRWHWCGGVVVVVCTQHIPNSSTFSSYSLSLITAFAVFFLIPVTKPVARPGSLSCRHSISLGGAHSGELRFTRSVLEKSRRFNYTSTHHQQPTKTSIIPSPAHNARIVPCGWTTCRVSLEEPS